MSRFLGRLWRLGLDVAENGDSGEAWGLSYRPRTREAIMAEGDRRHRATLPVQHTPISAVMELVNDVYAARKDGANGDGVRFATETAVSLISLTPRTSPRLWERLGHERLLGHVVAAG